MNTRHLIAGLALAVATALAPCTASAAPLSAYEIISDSDPVDAFTRDLTRTRWSTTGGMQVETDDAAIDVNANFGLLNYGQVVYTHDMTWLTPPAATFLTGALTIQAYGAFGSNDQVVAETVSLGNLTNGLFGSTSVFNGLAVLNALQNDGKLTITISKNVNSPLPVFPVSIVSSRLDVRYEPVPEPTSLAVFGLAAAAAAVRLRRRR